FLRNWPREQKGIYPRELLEIESGRENVAGVELMSFQEVLKSIPFWLLTVCQVISAATIYSLITWLPSFLTSDLQLSFARMGNLLFVGYLLATALSFAVSYIADRTMKRALTAAWVSLFFVFVVLPGAMLLPPVGSALLLSSLTAVCISSGALQGALIHTLIRPEAIARGTGIYIGVGTFVSAAGPTIFGLLINALDGQYWGGFLFLALLNAVGAGCFFALHRMSSKAIRAAAVLHQPAR
ncbi:MAG: MFS transporter, partial [Acidobacteriota bacterium]